MKFLASDLGKLPTYHSGNSNLTINDLKDCNMWDEYCKSKRIYNLNFNVTQPDLKMMDKLLIFGLFNPIFMKVSRCIRVISPINYWQVFVPHPLRFGYHFVSVYYHLKEHSVNFFWFFKGFLNYSVHPSNYWVFKNAYFQWFFVRIMDLKKKFQDVSLCKKVSMVFES